MIPVGTFVKVIACAEPSLSRFIGASGEVVGHGYFNHVNFPSGDEKAFADKELLIVDGGEAQMAISRICSKSKLKRH